MGGAVAGRSLASRLTDDDVACPVLPLPLPPLVFHRRTENNNDGDDDDHADVNLASAEVAGLVGG